MLKPNIVCKKEFSQCVALRPSLMRYIASACVVAAFISCNRGENTSSLNDGGIWKEVIKIEPENIDEELMLNASELVESIKYIPLKTPPGVFIGDIKDMVWRHNRMYIRDNNSNSVFVFDNQGGFLAMVNSIGEGPDEYLRIDAFAVDKTEDKVLIYCARRKKIVTYDGSGKFLGEESTEALISSFSASGGNKLYIYTAAFPNQQIFKESFPEQSRFLFLKNMEMVSKSLRFEYNEEILQYPKSKSNFHWFGDTLTLTEPMGNKVYRVSESGVLKPRFLVDFGKATNRLSFDSSKEEVHHLVQEFRENGNKNLCRLSAITESDNAIFIRYSYQGHMLSSVYESKAKS